MTTLGHQAGDALYDDTVPSGRKRKRPGRRATAPRRNIEYQESDYYDQSEEYKPIIQNTGLPGCGRRGREQNNISDNPEEQDHSNTVLDLREHAESGDEDEVGATPGDHDIVNKSTDAGQTEEPAETNTYPSIERSDISLVSNIHIISKNSDKKSIAKVNIHSTKNNSNSVPLVATT